jgi:hypothetical protein
MSTTPPVWRPFHDPKVEHILTTWNLRFELVEAIEIASIARVDDQQARSVAHRATPELVAEYHEQMKAGAPFPPIVLRNPRLLLDGNTRLAAAEKLGLAYAPAYIVSDIATNEMARSVSGAINETNGVRLSEAEAYERAVEMMFGELKFPPEAVAFAVGRSAAQVRRYRRQALTAQRAERLGITEDLRAVQPASHREKIADIDWDEPFRRVVGAISGVKVPAGELAALLRDMDNAASEAAQIEMIETAAAQWRPTGPTHRIARNKKAQHMRMLIPQLLKVAPAELIDSDKIAEDRALWDRLRAQVDAVLTEFDNRGITAEALA